MDYKTLVAGSGKEAMEIFEAHKERIDMVILDMIMPNMSCGEVYDRMKDINPNVKVLLSTGEPFEVCAGVSGRASRLKLKK